MRIVLDVSIAADNRIEGTATWADRAEPVAFTGWLALMQLFEDANGHDAESAQSTGGSAERFAVPGADP